jgi:hypothetical protein
MHSNFQMDISLPWIDAVFKFFQPLTTELGQKTAWCESLRVLLPYVEWDRFVTLAGSISGLRVTLSYLGPERPETNYHTTIGTDKCSQFTRHYARMFVVFHIMYSSHFKSYFKPMHPHLPTATHRQTSPPPDTDYWVTETEKWMQRKMGVVLFTFRVPCSS